jgi:uncharacterized protein YfaS (alpha-2-macroglobulin family)
MDDGTREQRTAPERVLMWVRVLGRSICSRLSAPPTFLPSQTPWLPYVSKWVFDPDKRSRLFSGLALFLVGALSILMLVEDRPLPPRIYTEAWSLVEPTISQNAYIRVNIPEGVEVQNPQEALTFVPEIKGSFVASPDPRTVLYKPNDTLVLGAFYSAVVEEGAVRLSGSFKTVEDPKILTILPGLDTETHEDSKISIVFNRPMVPLSTLSERDTYAVPVTLDPPTPGAWVWKSTRLLQFVPTERLQQSSTYTVRVSDSLRSLDGLLVPEKEHVFRTRTLKRTGTSDAKILFNQPFRITYNLGVDLERTQKEVHVFRDEVEVPVHVRYAKKEEEKKRSFLGLALFGSTEEVQTSILEIVPVEDTHGRAGLWDIDATYRIEVARTYPTEGDIVLDEPLSTSISIPGAIKEVRAWSARSDHVDQYLFDPEGRLSVSFYEPVSLDKTLISLKGLANVTYGTMCRTDDMGNMVYQPGTEECVRTEDTTTLDIEVDAGVYAKAEEAMLSFDRIVVEDGTVISTEPQTIPIRTYPKPELLASNPSRDSTSIHGSLTQLELCTNVPLTEPEPGTFRDAIKTNEYLVFAPTPWHSSYKLSSDDYVIQQNETVCRAGQYRTLVQYGLHPSTAYRMNLSLTDDFDQLLVSELSFTTEKNTASYARLTALQPVYNVTVPGRTTLTYAGENLESVTVHVCKVSAHAFLALLEKGLSEYTDTFVRSTPCTEETSTVVDLPDTYFVNNYFQVDIATLVSDPKGQYIVTLYHPTFSQNTDGPKYLRSYLSVTTLAVGQKSVGWYEYGEDKETKRTKDPKAQDLYWVMRGSTLEPIAGAEIVPYESASAWWDSTAPLTALPTTVTGEDGVARARSVGTVRGAVVTYQGDSAVVSEWADGLDYARASGGESRTYLYTDRPIYRPGDTVHLKGIDRVGYDGQWEVVKDVPATLVVRDSRGEEVSKQEVPLSEYGTFETSLVLPKDASLGTWNIEAFGNSGYFDVEEYTPSAFKLNLVAEKEEYVAGDTLDVAVDAQYYFGLPVSNATAEYDIVAQDYHFDRVSGQGWWSFGRGWYYCYECGFGDTFIRRGSVVLDAEGAGSIQVPLTFADFFKNPSEEQSKLFTVTVRVKDESGRQVAKTQSVIVHRGEYYLGVRTEPGFAEQGTPVRIQHKSVDVQGAPRGNTDITRAIEKVSWRSFKRREVDGGYYWHNEEVRTPISSATLKTDRNGDADERVTFAEAGEYEITTSSIDSRRNSITATTRIYIYGDGAVSVQETNNTSLTLHTDAESYAPGAEGTVLFESPFKKAKALVTVERGDIFSYSIVDVMGSMVASTFRIDEKLIPNGFVSVMLLGQSPEVRYGSVPFAVARDTEELTVEVTPTKERYLPGEHVELTVQTKDQSGMGVPAEVSVAVVDLSVLALKGNPKKNPLLFFYGDMPLGVSTRHNLKNVLLTRDIPTGTKGGGGGDPADLAQKKRGEFRDTAHWEAQVQTDSTGTARVSFKLPDNLTTWQIESLGVTKDLLLGVNYREIVTSKPLMAIPKKPRFILPGDTFSLGAQIFNDTDNPVSVEFGVSSKTLTLDTALRTVRVAPHDSTLVYVEAVAPRTQTTGVHSVTFTATYPGESDVVEQTIPIQRTSTFETFATMFAGTEPSMSEFVYLPKYALQGEGEVTIRTRATLAGMLVDGAGYLAEYPYGCAEQTMSRLVALSLVKRMRDTFGETSVSSMQTPIDPLGAEKTLDEAMQEGLKQIYAIQAPSGGFGWYSGLYPEYYLTVEVVRGLLILKESGIIVQDSAIHRALAYIQKTLASDPDLIASDESVAGLALMLSYPDVPEAYRSLAMPYIVRMTKNPLTLESLSSTALGYLALATARGEYATGIHDTFFHVLENRLAVDARGAYVKDGTEDGSVWYETPEKNTGLFLATVAKHGGEHPLASQALSWLMARRGKDFSWQSTNTTATVLDAVLGYAIARKEHETSFSVSISKDDTGIAEHAFSEGSLFTTHTDIVPIDALERQKMTRMTFTKNDQGKIPGTLYYDVALRYAIPPEYVIPRDEGITVERTFTTLDTHEERVRARVGEILQGTLTITIPEEYSAVSVEDFIPAGFEIVNTRLATEEVPIDDDIAVGESIEEYPPYYDEYADASFQDFGTGVIDPLSTLLPFPEVHSEYRDDRVFAFADRVHPGVYTLTYYVRALVPGTFTHLPATVSEMYQPEIFGRTGGGTFEVEE